MGRKVIDRTGEENINEFGSKMIIKEYKSNKDIDVYFPEYNWTAKHVQYNNFKNGTIKCPYEPRVYGVGYLGEGKYKAFENEVEYNKISNDEIKRRIILDYEGRISDWN